MSKRLELSLIFALFVSLMLFAGAQVSYAEGLCKKEEAAGASGACARGYWTIIDTCAGATPICDQNDALCYEEEPQQAENCKPCNSTDFGFKPFKTCAGKYRGTAEYCAADGRCAQCVDDTQCAGATPACESTSYTCVECTATNQSMCAGDTPVCNTATNKCVGCVDTCPDSSQICTLAHTCKYNTCASISQTCEDPAHGNLSCCVPLDCDSNICTGGGAPPLCSCHKDPKDDSDNCPPGETCLYNTATPPNVCNTVGSGGEEGLCIKDPTPVIKYRCNGDDCEDDPTGAGEAVCPLACRGDSALGWGCITAGDPCIMNGGPFDTALECQASCQLPAGVGTTMAGTMPFPNLLDWTTLVNYIATAVGILSMIINMYQLAVGGYQIMTCQGDPTKLLEGKGRCTSAVVSIVFTILALSILKIISNLFVG